MPRRRRTPVRFPKHLEARYAAVLLRRLGLIRTLLLERLPRARRDEDDVVVLTALRGVVEYSVSTQAPLAPAAPVVALQATAPAAAPAAAPAVAVVESEAVAAAATAQAEAELAARHLRVVLRAVEQAVVTTLPPDPAPLLPIASAVDQSATAAIETVIPIDVLADPRLARPAVQQLQIGWAREGVDLIRTMEADLFDDLAREVARAVAEGRTDLAAVIEQRFGVASNRARLIARDQVAKLNGRITEHRQTSLGITKYRWSSSGDERVRPTHRANDGNIYEWSNPPATGHPGQDIACRCVAIPVIDDEDDG